LDLISLVTYLSPSLDNHLLLPSRFSLLRYIRRQLLRLTAAVIVGPSPGFGFAFTFAFTFAFLPLPVVFLAPSMNA
jgi:hypothetical protein